jgi:hypothetical protein
MAEGTQVGAYRVLRQIGEGGKGAVWRAEHPAAISTRSFNEARAAIAIADPGAREIGDAVPPCLQRGHPGPGRTPLIRCSRA